MARNQTSKITTHHVMDVSPPPLLCSGCHSEGAVPGEGEEEGGSLPARWWLGLALAQILLSKPVRHSHTVAAWPISAHLLSRRPLAPSLLPPWALYPALLPSYHRLRRRPQARGRGEAVAVRRRQNLLDPLSIFHRPTESPLHCRSRYPARPTR